MYPQQRRRPNKHTDRFAWEASWERDLKAFYDRPLQDLPRPTSDPLYPRSLSFLGTPSHLLNLDNKSQEICALQSDIRRAVLHTCGDFEQKWRTLATRKRREFVLEGLYQASCREWLEEKRGLCPEFTLTLLAAGDGSEYLRLLRAVLPSTSNTKVLATKSPVFIPHDRIDYIWALPHAHREILGLRAWTTDILLDRTFFASMTIWSIFAAVYGEYEQLDASFISPHPIEEQEQLQEAQRICQHCGKHDSSSRSRRHLRACSGCLTVGRKIYYCSRDCQANNWKHGVPIPHEVTCGRIPSPSRIPASIDSADPRIPKPDASFERSTDLEHQISFLYQSPYVDYTFIFPYPLPDKGITVRPPPDRRTFLTLRDEALRTGDPEAVQVMYYMLIPFADNIGFARGSLKKQLEREYCIELQELPSSWNARIASHDVPSKDTFEAERDLGAHNLHGDMELEDALSVFPGALDYTENTDHDAPRSAADRFFVAGIYYALFAFLSLGFVLLATKFLLKNPLLVLCIAPFLGILFRALASAFRAGQEWAWHE